MDQLVHNIKPNYIFLVEWKIQILAETFNVAHSCRATCKVTNAPTQTTHIMDLLNKVESNMFLIWH
jgi:hypothetical protein